MKTIDCDIVLLPPPEIVDRAIEASQAVAKLGTHFVLDNINYFPHLSLYMLQIEESTIPQISNILEALASQTDPIALEALPDYFCRGGYTDVQYGPNQNRDVLQEKVIESLNPLRSGIAAVSQKRANTEGKIGEYIRDYGYWGIKELARPHITFTKFLEPPVEDITHLLPSNPEKIFSGTFSRLGFFEIDTNGSCIRKIATFDLQ